jgi:hypothetical protein
MGLKALRSLNVKNEIQRLAVGDGSALEELAQPELGCGDWSFGGIGGGHLIDPSVIGWVIGLVQRYSAGRGRLFRPGLS